MIALAEADTSLIGDFASKFGFPAVLVVILLWGIWKLQERADTQREAREVRDEEREKERRLEREADRKAHVDALGQIADSLKELTQKVEEMRPRAVR